MADGKDSVNAKNGTSVLQKGDTRTDCIDLRCDGPIDQCTEMLAEKIFDPSFWNGAEQFLAQPAPLGGYEIVRKALSRHIRHLLGESVPSDQLLLVPNASVALELFVRCCCSPGDVVLCPIPFAADEFLSEEFRSANSSIDFVTVNLPWNSSLLSCAELQQTTEGLGKKRVRALLLHNPNPIFGWNGDGQRQLAHILEWATERGIFLLVDESLATMDLWEFISCLGLDRSRLVWLWSAAKHFSLPGLEFAALLFPSADLVRLSLPFLQIHSCAPLVQYLVANLLEDLDWSSELFARRKSRIEELRAKTIEGVAELGVSRTLMSLAKSTQWVLIDLKTFLDDINFESERILRDEFSQKAHLKLTSGEELGMTDPGWFRIRVESNEDKMNEVLNRLRMILEGRRRRRSIWEWEKKDMSIYGGGRTETVWTEEEQKGKEKETEDGAKKKTEEKEKEETEEKEEKKLDEKVKREKETGKKETEEKEKEGKEMGKKETEEKEEKEEKADEKVKEETKERNEGEGKKEREDKEEKEAEETNEAEKKEQKDKIGTGKRTKEEEMFDEEFLRQIFTFGEFRKRERAEEEKKEEEEKDEIIQKVFSIFPKERLIWKGSVEEKCTKDQKEKEETDRRREEKEVREWAGEGEEGTKMSNGAELWRKGGNGEEKQQKAKESISTTNKLSEMNFVEEMIKGMEGEFYDEVSTEEEGENGRKSEKEKRTEWGRGEGEEQSKDGGPNGHLKGGGSMEQSDVQIYRMFEERRHSPFNDVFFMESIRRDQSVFDHYASDSNLAYHPRHLCPLTRSDSGELSSEFGFGTSSDPIDIHPPELILDDNIRSRDSAFLSDSSPAHTSALAQMNDERNYGPTAQMMNDSGIFLDFLPGSLSIDFPLLVSTEKLRTQNEEGNDEGKRSTDEGRAITVELQFKTPKAFTEEELRTTDVERKEEDESREDEPFEVAEWKPLEEIEAEKAQIEEKNEEKVARTQMGRNKAKNDTLRNESDAQQKLASQLNEGSSFCPAKQQVSWIEVNGSEIGQIDGERVPIWKPMEEFEDEEKWENMAEERRTQCKENDEMDQLEKKATDVVEEWNARVGGKVGEEEEEEETEVELHFVRGERTEREAATKVRFGRDWANRRTTVRDTEDEVGRKDEGPVHFEKRENEMPGRASYFQIHQRMKMGRKLEDDDYNKSMPRDTIILEHMNITELEYSGGTIGRRGQRVQTSISTQINRWAADEWFKQIPTREGLEEEKDERVKSKEEVRRRRNSRMDESSERGTKVRSIRRKRETEEDDEERAGTKGNGEGQPPQLYSEFETIHHGKTEGSIARTRHRQKRQQPKSPSRVTVTTTFGGGENGDDDGALGRDRVTVTHTPGSNWIVSSVYRSTEWGWEKVSLPAERR
ncbi:hypothetical protein niasHT_023899 [Heterodera trifolii]|uniref:Aminotransferase class I/classII large domain-containing protein n=1 Tax=Heterodera trifolii TaxID=157864 RepID=A0ABD2JCJ0_9BILA